MGIALKCQIRKLDDKAAFIAQATENEQREEISAWARARDYDHALKNKIFPSVPALAASLGLDRSSVTNILYLNKIPQDIVDAAGDMQHLGIQAAKTMLKYIEGQNGASHRKIIIENAHLIAEGKMGVKKIERLCEAVQTKPTSSQTVRGKQGDLFSIATTSRGALNITILKNAKRLLTEQEIIEALKAAFEEKGE